MLKKRLLLLCFLISYSFLFPQSSNLSLDRELNKTIDPTINNKENNFHTGLKPYLASEVNKFYPDSNERKQLYILPFVPEKKEIKIQVTPLLAALGGYESNDGNIPYQLQAGIHNSISIGQNFSSEINVFTARENFVSYLDTAVKYSETTPGFGSSKSNSNSYSYNFYSGYVSYAPNKIFNFQAGVDKHFWGDGYRSLILSDAVNPYPFLKISTTVWKIKYVSLFTAMKDASVRNNVKQKYGTFHYLSWNVCKRLNLSLFESVIWQGSDTNRYRGYDINYLNPVLFFRPAEYSVGSSDNSLLGMGFKLILFKKHAMYGQIVLDEFLLNELKNRTGWWANKYSIQGGYKIFDVGGLKGLYLQAEYNYVRPYTYSHGSVQQNYAHYNIPLAHPRGANFTEAIGIVSYTKNKLSIEGKVVYVQYGADTSNVSYGSNIFLSYKNRFSEYGNTVGQGLSTKVAYAGIKGSYLVLPKSNIRIELGAMTRMSSNALLSTNTIFIYAGIKTSLGNFYNDYQ